MPRRSLEEWGRSLVEFPPKGTNFARFGRERLPVANEKRTTSELSENENNEVKIQIRIVWYVVN